MNYGCQPQPLDYKLVLELLVYSIRTMTARFLAQAHGITVGSAKKRLNRLADGRFVYRFTGWVSDIPPIEPLIEWHPGDPTPEFGPAANIAQRRWDSRPVKPTTLYTATHKLLAMYSLPPRERLKDHHATHDLAIAYVYDYCRRRWPHLQFVGEDIFAPERSFGEGVEDAQLRSGNDIWAVAEYSGAYRRDRVAHFHRHVCDRNLSYFMF